MMSRTAVVAVLVAIELAVASEIVAAVRGSQPSPFVHLGVERATGPDLVENDAPRRFPASARPVLYVDIGYADLTIRPGPPSAFDVSVAASPSHGVMRSKAPLAARAEGDALHVATTRTESWTSGDDRMVTLVIPPQTRIVVRNAGNIDVSGMRGDTSLHSLARGTVSVADYAAGDLHVAATDGDVTLRGIAATRLDISTGDGRVAARALSVRDGKIESESGAVALAFAPGANTSVTAETDGGNVRVAGGAAHVTHATTDGSSTDMRIGAGEGRLDVRSSDDIDLTP